MSVTEQSARVPASRRTGLRLTLAAVTVMLVLASGIATAAMLPELAIRVLSYATMLAALASGIAAVRRGPAWMRAISAIVGVLALMLGSTFFGLTYS
ncbi:hypothetical protein [Agromyces soli]|uniref:Uncharacterized protein n=1 Tax=Agromyces soli TaxID=659012 RepID=A0ABY4ATA3_9MICO|nr:hypothetical protein [Agromyces soli]UOE25086.1 hypothetical protein MTP13_12085 [Agromyces soli]